MATIIDTIWDNANAISTENIKSWELFDLLIKENNIIKISLNSNITLKIYANEYIREGELVSALFDDNGNITGIYKSDIRTALYSNIIGIAKENIQEETFGDVLVIGKYDNFYLNSYSQLLANDNDVYNYSPLFLNEDGKVITINDVGTILENDLLYLDTVGIKLNKNEMFFYPKDKIPVSSFNNPEIVSTYAKTGDVGINKGDLLHLDTSTTPYEIRKANLPNDYNVIGIAYRDYDPNITINVSYIQQGRITQSSGYFPQTFEPNTFLTANTKNIFLQNKNTSNYQVSNEYDITGKIMNMGWMTYENNEYVFYLNPYLVTINPTLVPKKNINLSFPERNVMSGSSINLFNFEIPENQTIYLVEGQLGTINEQRIALLNENVYSTIKIYKQNTVNGVVQSNLIINEVLYKYKEFNHNNSVTGPAKIVIELHNNSLVNKVFCNGYINCILVE